MNDASGENVDEHVQALEGEPEKLQQSMDNDQAHLDPSRWFFASSLFPMIAGTLGPVASAFSICALVRPWRQFYPPGSDIQTAQYVPDPEWLLAINGAQLVIAVVANLSLLLNMTKRLRFTIAQPVTIVGWYISAIALVALDAAASSHLLLEPWSDYVWSQAFYYGIYAAILYFVVASLMVVTFWGAYTGHYAKDFQLTTSQRTLMLQTIMFLMYLLLGALVFSKIEGWNYLDAVYWADVTLFTVGFGDFAAVTTLGRALLLPYALVGIISLGLVIGSIRALVLDRGKRRVDARMIEKKRRTILKNMTQKGRDSILEPISEKETNGKASRPGSGSSGLTEFQRREEEFNLMRKIQHKAARRRRWVAMATSSGTWIVLWLVGAKIFQACEEPYQHWSYFDGVYLCFVSLTTIGYGDITPISNPGKSFFVFWSLLALPTMTILISNAGDTVVKGIRDATNTLGTITILPGEQGFKKDLKEVFRMLSFGKLFEEDIKDTPPGFLGNAEEHSDESDEEMDITGREQDQAMLNAEKGGTRKADKERERTKKEKAAAQMEKVAERSQEHHAAEKREHDAADREGDQGSSERAVSFETPPSVRQRQRRNTGHGTPSPPSGRKNQTGPKRASTMRSLRHASTEPKHDSPDNLGFKRTASFPRQDLPKDVPKDKDDYHLLLIEEISLVTRHLKTQPPRKYSWPEWAWYLKLIGEDEANAATHKKARPHVHTKDGGEKDTGGAMDENSAHEGQKQQWSWVGARSPLMGSQEEAEWILEKLTQKLTQQLRDVREAGKSRKKPADIQEHDTLGHNV